MKLGRWTVGMKLWTLTSVLMLDVLFVGLMQSSTSSALMRQMRDITDSHLPAVQSMAMLDMRRDGVRAVVLDSLLGASGQDWERGRQAREEIAELSDAMDAHLGVLVSLPLLPETRKAVEEARGVVRRYLEAAKDVLTLVRDQRPDESRARLLDFTKSFEALEAQLGALGSQIALEAKRSKEKAEQLMARASITNTFLLVCGVVLGLVASVLVVGSHVRKLTGIVTRLSDEAGQVADGAVKVNGASQNLSQAAVEQASAVEETVASMEEMAATISKTADNASKSHSVTQKGEEEAQKGKQVIAHMLAAMEGIEASNSKLQSLVQLIQEIEAKTQIINDIVFETRLLSFNASIEAARAGVHGKGFSVVAEEVGKLAVLSGKAADEIRSLLDSSTAEVAKIVSSTQESVLAGKNAFRDCEQAFNSMGDTLQRIRDSVEQIATATQQQEVGVEQTNKAMVAIDHATLNNSKSAETLSALAVDLERGADSLKNSIASMRALVSGDTAQGAAQRSSPRRAPGSSRDPESGDAAGAGVTRVDPCVSRSDSRWERAEALQS